MKTCQGLFGRLFGHNMREFTTKSVGATPEQLQAITGRYPFFPSMMEAIRQLGTKENSIVCKRCGGRPE